MLQCSWAAGPTLGACQEALRACCLNRPLITRSGSHPHHLGIGLSRSRRAHCAFVARQHSTMTCTSTKLVAGLLAACLCSSVAGADTTGTTVGGYTFGSDIQGEQQALPLHPSRTPHACGRCTAATHLFRLCALCCSISPAAAAHGLDLTCTAQCAPNAGLPAPAASRRYQSSCFTAASAAPRGFLCLCLHAPALPPPFPSLQGTWTSARMCATSWPQSTPATLPLPVPSTPTARTQCAPTAAPASCRVRAVGGHTPPPPLEFAADHGALIRRRLGKDCALRAHAQRACGDAHGGRQLPCCSPHAALPACVDPHPPLSAPASPPARRVGHFRL